MTELRQMDGRHFVIVEWSHLANGCTIKMCLHPSDVISLSIISGRNNMRYKYYRISFGIFMCDALVASCATAH